MSGVRKLKQSEAARQDGELARLKVVRGPDRGAAYVILARHLTIGRGEDADVMLTDLKASRRHAELVLDDVGHWSMRDLGSANGISWNGQAVRSGVLKSRDTIGMGETLLEFVSVEAGTAMLSAPPVAESQIQKERVGLALQKAKIAALSRFGGLAKNSLKVDLSPPQAAHGTRKSVTLSASDGKGKSGSGKRGFLIGAAVIGGYLLFLYNPDAPKTIGSGISDKNEAINRARDLASLIQQPGSVPPQLERSADIFYRSGFREYTQGNWVRARTQFETVLQMSPGHPLARLYLENCEKEIDREVKANLEQGRNGLESGKLHQARGNFEAVLRLLYRDPANPDYIQAKTALDKVNLALSAPETGAGG